MSTKGHHKQIWFKSFTGEDFNSSENQKQKQKMTKASMSFSLVKLKTASIKNANMYLNDYCKFIDILFT